MSTQPTTSYADLIERLWSSDAASALTNEAARALEKMERLMGALEKIANGYPCADAESMRKVASDALGDRCAVSPARTPAV